MHRAEYNMRKEMLASFAGVKKHRLRFTMIKERLIRWRLPLAGCVIVLIYCALLSFVSGISKSLAKAIIHQRDAQRGFVRRDQLLKVPRFGQKTYE